MAFNVPINSIAPLPTPSDWVRPNDWISITDTANEVQFLVADTGIKAFAIQTTFIKNSGTNIYIDWGDGTVDTISTINTTITNHVYSTGGTPCSRGYNTFKIRVYSDATCVITNAKHFPNFAVTGGNNNYNIGLLEAYFGDNTCNTNAFGLSGGYLAYFNTGQYSTFKYLEYVKLPSTVTWTTQLNYMFGGATNLYKVVMPTSASSLTNFTQTFQGCNNLRDVILPSNSVNITSLLNAFASCFALRTISFPTSLNSCTSLNNAFSNCYSLKNITLPSINLVNDFNSTFLNCVSLQWFKFTSLPSPVSPSTAIAFPSFVGLTQLQNVYLPSTCSANAIYNMSSVFSGCVSLKNIVFPTNFNANTLSSCFQNCRSLTNVIFPTSMSSLTVFDTCFSGCTLLQSIVLPTTVGATISMTSIFTSCLALSTITIPSTWNITSLNSAFNGCTNIKSIDLPNNTQNSITSLSNTFINCYLLESVILPTSLNAANSLNSTFSGCINLKSIALPSTMNAVTSMFATFYLCSSLSSLTLPTSMSSCSNFQQTFWGCSLESITMPSIVSSSTSTFATFAYLAPNLKTLTLPTTQTSLVNSINTMFSGCGNLTTITNLGKIGSLTATPLVSAGNNNSSNLLTSLSFNCPFSLLNVNGTSATNFNKLNSLRLLNTGTGQWTSASPQINVSYCDLGVAALDQLFTDLTTIVGKTINITGCSGAAGCTRSIATAKGWTVTG
jgi:hypothetical protein